jgi:zona occludens toxin
MIFLVTGSPGGGKTLNTLKFINEDDQFKDRPIYYFNIKDLTLDWSEIEADQVKKWQSLPDNSIIVVDEAQRVFPKRSNNITAPTGVSELDTHRHRGFDFFFITQHPTLVDHDLRKFVGQHRHYERSFGMDSTRMLTWQKAQYNVDDYHIRQEAETTRIKFDKKYYNTYKSATDHNVKKRIPAKLWFVIIGALGSVGGIIYFVSTFGVSSPNPDLNNIPSPRSLTPSLNINKSNEEFGYFENLTPRVASLPSSAPQFDSLTEPQSFPRISACVTMAVSDACQCYSQQATKINVPVAMCLQIVSDGYFDPSIPDIRSSDLDRQNMRVVSKPEKFTIAADTQRPRSILINQSK